MRPVVAAILLAAATAHADNTEPAPPSLTDQQLLEQSLAETIEIYDERPDKPFDRDTEVRLTGEQLAARGATDLGDALALLPDVTVRDAGRGGFNIDVRGGRKGEVQILIDGVPITDPYVGTFDVSSIPITDIVQIRVSTVPQSPIDGPNGSGGVIEVLTRDAVGPQIVIARVTGDTLPSYGVSGTARAAISKHTAIRVSATGQGDQHDFGLTSGQSLGEDRRDAGGAARFEYREGDRRLVVDGFLDDRHYVQDPGEIPTLFTVIDREASERISAKYDDKLGKTQLQAEAWLHGLQRRSRTFMDPALSQQTVREQLVATRSGGQLLVTRPFAKDWRWAASVVVEHETATDDATTTKTVEAFGDTTELETAGDLQYEHKQWRVDASAGVAFPFGTPNTDPWPEAKLDVKYKPMQELQLSGTLGRKGRVPSLNERYDPSQGNPMLGAEKTDHAEIRAVETRDWLRLELAPFYRFQTGTIMADPNMKGQYGAVADLTIYGVDALARAQVHRMVEVGGGYAHYRATNETSRDAIPRLPRNKAEGWVNVRPDPRLALLARVTYFGDNYQGTTLNAHYTLVSATATLQATKQYLIVARCDDLLDEAPITRAGFRAPGRTISVVLQGSWE